MINIIEHENIESINNVSNEIVSLLKSNKVYFTSDYNGSVRIKPSDCLFQVTRTIDGNDKFTKITAENNDILDNLKSLVNSLDLLIENVNCFRAFKIKDYSLQTIKVKLCRELVSKLEDMYVLGDVNRKDIDHVYETLGKSTPKKFASNDILEGNKELYYAIRNSMKDKAEDIKNNSITHYIKMTQRIDPNNEFNNPKDFINAGKKYISDINTLRLCYIYKFRNDDFFNLINDEFDIMIGVAANNISAKNNGSHNNIKVISLNIGAKGFDIKISIDDNYFNARAIPVEGSFVRFHYRYIIT